MEERQPLDEPERMNEEPDSDSPENGLSEGRADLASLLSKEGGCISEGTAIAEGGLSSQGTAIMETGLLSEVTASIEGGCISEGTAITEGVLFEGTAIAKGGLSSEGTVITEGLSSEGIASTDGGISEGTAIAKGDLFESIAIAEGGLSSEGTAITERGLSDEETASTNGSFLSEGTAIAEGGSLSEGTAITEGGFLSEGTASTEGGFLSEETATTEGGEEAVGAEGLNLSRSHRLSEVDREFINEFIARFQRAVDADRSQDYSEALKLYKTSLSFGLSLLKPNGPGSRWSEILKNRVRSKLTDYMDRAEAIKGYLQAQQYADSVKRDGPVITTLPAHGGLTSLMLECRQEFLVKPTVKWGDLVGMEQVKDKLKEWVILPLRFPQLFQGVRMPRSWGNMLLYGPPGCGKTLLTQALASEIENATLFHVSAYSLAADQYGNRKVDALFELAQLHKPCLIVLDEVDYLYQTNLSRQILMSIVIRLSGQDRHRSPESKVMVFSCSHSPNKLWPCVRRRFPWRLYLKPPDHVARAGIIEKNLNGVNHDLSQLDIQELAARTKGWAGSDLVVLTRGAAMGPIRKLSAATHFVKVPRSSLPPTTSTDGVGDTSEYVYTPCSPETEAAIEAKITSLPPEELLLSPVSMDDFRIELTKCGSSIDKEQLKLTEEFHEDYGLEDAPRKRKGEVLSLKSQTRKSLLEALAPLFSSIHQRAAHQGATHKGPPGERATHKGPTHQRAGVVCQEFAVVDQLPIPRSLKVYLLAETSETCP